MSDLQIFLMTGLFLVGGLHLIVALIEKIKK